MIELLGYFLYDSIMVSRHFVVIPRKHVLTLQQDAAASQAKPGNKTSDCFMGATEDLKERRG